MGRGVFVPVSLLKLELIGWALQWSRNGARHLKFTISGQDFRFKSRDATQRQRQLKNKEHPWPFGSAAINGSFGDGSQEIHKEFWGQALGRRIWGSHGGKTGQEQQ